MKPKRTKSSYILLVGIMSLLLVGSWLAYQIYVSLTKTQISSRQQVAITPLDGSFAKTDLDNLAARRKFTSADFSAIVIDVSAVPVATGSSL